MFAASPALEKQHAVQMKPETDPSHRGLKTLFTTAVWGADYVERFLKYSLRTQLSAGNLGHFDRNSLYLLITDAESIKYISSSPIFEKLASLVSTEFVDIERFRTGNLDKYSLLTVCQNYALERATDFNALFFGYGDALWADGSYRAAAQRLKSGFHAVFSFGYPVLDKPFKAAVQSRSRSDGAPEVSIAPRDFAQLVYNHLHPMAHANRWDNRWMSHCPSYVVWDVPDQGLLLRAFHMHPVALQVQKEAPYFFAPFRSTLDEEFVARLNRTNPRIYVSPSSDEIGVCSLAEATDLTYRMNPIRPVNLNDLASFAEAHAGMVHRRLFSRSTRLVTADVDESKWQPVEAEAAMVDREVKEALSTPDSVLALENPTAFSARLRRQVTYEHWNEKDTVLLDFRRVNKANSRSTGAPENAAPLRMPHHSSPSVASILVAENFSRSFQSMSDASTSKSIGLTRRLQMKSVTGTINFLHATKVTRMVRIYVLPVLPEKMRMHIYERAYRLGAIGHPISKAIATDNGGPLVRLIRWFKRTLGLRS